MNLKTNHIKSYIKRDGRLTTGQKNALKTENNHILLKNIDYQIDCQQLFNNQSNTILEIGFGNGQSLLNQCIQFPHNNYIGIEVYLAGIGQLINCATQFSLQNLRIIEGDAFFICQNNIADNSIAKVQIFFPDPWHKKKHHKRRLLDAEFLNKVYRILHNKGVLHIVTDNQSYYEHIKKAIESTLFKVCNRKHFDTIRNSRMTTKYELRAQSLNHNIYTLIYNKYETI